MRIKGGQKWYKRLPVPISRPSPLIDWHQDYNHISSSPLPERGTTLFVPPFINPRMRKNGTLLLVPIQYVKQRGTFPGFHNKDVKNSVLVTKISLASILWWLADTEHFWWNCAVVCHGVDTKYFARHLRSDLPGRPRQTLPCGWHWIFCAAFEQWFAC